MLDDAATLSPSVVRSFTQTVASGELFEQDDGEPVAVDLPGQPSLSEAPVLCFEPVRHDHSVPASAPYTTFGYQACVPNAAVDPVDTGHTCSAVRSVDIVVHPLGLPPV
jgi:hypothetical protein